MLATWLSSSSSSSDSSSDSDAGGRRLPCRYLRLRRCRTYHSSSSAFFLPSGWLIFLTLLGWCLILLAARLLNQPLLPISYHRPLPASCGERAQELRPAIAAQHLQRHTLSPLIEVSQQDGTPSCTAYAAGHTDLPHTTLKANSARAQHDGIYRLLSSSAIIADELFGLFGLGVDGVELRYGTGCGTLDVGGVVLDGRLEREHDQRDGHRYADGRHGFHSVGADAL